MKDLILKSLTAHKKYVIDNTLSAKARKYYSRMMDDIIQIIEYNDNYLPIVIGIYKTFTGLEKKPFDRERKYKDLALQHAMDVVLMMHERFLGK